MRDKVMEDLNGINTKIITEIAKYLSSVGKAIPWNYPLSEKHFITIHAVIYADGLKQAE